MVAYGTEVDRFFHFEGARQRLFVLSQRLIERAEGLLVDQIDNPDAAAGDLVLVTGTDAARGGADGHTVLAGFGDFLDDAVEREDHLGAVADGELPAHVDAFRFEGFDLGDQRRRVDDHSVADDRLHAGPQDAGGNQLQNELVAADAHGVAGVMAALKARHHVEAFAEQVDDFAFSFVAPLRAEHYEVLNHLKSKTPHCSAGGMLRWPGCCFPKLS
jgi:hypothetical protein